MKQENINLVFNFLLLFSLLFAVDYSVGLFYGGISDKVLEKAPNASRTAYTIKEANAEILIFGASRANHHYVSSIISDSLNKTVFNCGLDGQPFAYSVAMIHAILKRYTPHSIIVDIAPRMLDNDYSFGNLNELYPYYSDDEFYKDLIIQEDPNNRYKMLSRMYRNNSKLVDLASFFILPDYVQDNGYAALPSNGYKFPQLSSVEYTVNTKVDSSEVELLLNCIKICEGKNVDLIFSVSPRFQISNVCYVNSFVILKRLLEKNDIPFIYMGDNSVIKDSVMYKDYAHLNHDGAVAFTNLFINELQKHTKH